MEARVWAAFGLAGAGTFAMRASFIVVAHRMTTVPPGVQRVLRQIPPAALASIVALAVLRPEAVWLSGSPGSAPGWWRRSWPGAPAT